MIDRSSIVHGGLAVAAIVVAGTAWLAPKGATDDQVTVIAGNPDETTELRWSDGDGEVAVARVERGVRVSVKSTRPPAANPLAPAAATPPPAAPARTRVYPGTEAAKDLFGKLVPFKVSRDLGAAAAEKLASYGLDKPTGKLVMKIGRDEQTVEVGGATFGGASSYVRAGGRVYLVKATTFTALKNGATGLTERGLVTVPREKIDSVTITAGARKREVIQRSAEDKAKAFFADPAEPEKRLAQTTNWLERLMRTRMTDFASARPQGEPQLVLELTGDRKPLGTLRMWAPTDAGAVVESSAYGEPVTIPKPTAETLLKDLDAVLNEAH